MILQPVFERYIQAFFNVIKDVIRCFLVDVTLQNIISKTFQFQCWPWDDREKHGHTLPPRINVRFELLAPCWECAEFLSRVFQEEAWVMYQHRVAREDCWHIHLIFLPESPKFYSGICPAIYFEIPVHFVKAQNDELIVAWMLKGEQIRLEQIVVGWRLRPQQQYPSYA